jgi:hypothetical protein
MLKFLAPVLTLVGTALTAQATYGLTAAANAGVPLTSGYSIAQIVAGLLGAGALGSRELFLRGSSGVPQSKLSFQVGDRKVDLVLSGESTPAFAQAVTQVVVTTLGQTTDEPKEGSNVAKAAR